MHKSEAFYENIFFPQTATILIAFHCHPQEKETIINTEASDEAKNEILDSPKVSFSKRFIAENELRKVQYQSGMFSSLKKSEHKPHRKLEIVAWIRFH